MSEMNLKSNIGVEESIANWLMAEPLFETSPPPGGGGGTTKIGEERALVIIGIKNIYPVSFVPL